MAKAIIPIASIGSTTKEESSDPIYIHTTKTYKKPTEVRHEFFLVYYKKNLWKIDIDR